MMGSRSGHLTLLAPTPPAARTCPGPGRPLDADAGDGLCRACHCVYATAEVLYQRLVAREMARLERRTPGIGCAALVALHARLAQFDPPIDPDAATGRAGDERAPWHPAEWELDRLDAFLAELRVAFPASEASS